MPGLAGFASFYPLSPRELDDRLQGLQDALITSDRHACERLLFGPQVGGALVFPNWRTDRCAHRTDTGLAIWFDGAIFNRIELCRQRNWTLETDADLLLAALTQPDVHPILKTIDGSFSAAVYDAHRGEIHLLVDRHGLRPLYWAKTRNGLVWASEPKAFLSLREWSPEIDPLAVETFLKAGQLSPDRPLLHGIESVPPATRLTFRLTSGAIIRERYWWWHEIAPLVGRLRLADLAEELGNRLKRAVERQAVADEAGLLLSGGLDSRAIFAALPKAVPTFTFGEQQSGDVAIAAQVAQIRKAEHTVLPIGPENWFAPRLEGVWWTDGALNLVHMHGVEHLSGLAQAVQIVLNGAGGDGLAGAGHLYEARAFPAYLTDTLGLDLCQMPEVAAQLKEAFNQAGSAHPFYIYWRMRGFTVHGPRLALFAGLDYRLPFLDNGVQEWLYAIALEHKRNNRLYRKMLLGAFPNFFRTIPWQATGHPISRPDWAVRGARAVCKLRAIPRPNAMPNYALWLREKPTRFLIDTLLLPEDAYHCAYAHSARDLWRRHLAGEDHTEDIGRYLTLELYLRQIFEGAPRTLEDALRAIPEI